MKLQAPKDYFTKAELCDYAGCVDRTIEREMALGKLKAGRQGGRPIFSPEQVGNWRGNSTVDGRLKGNNAAEIEMAKTALKKLREEQARVDELMPLIEDLQRRVKELESKLAKFQVSSFQFQAREVAA